MVWFGRSGMTDFRDRRETGAWFCVSDGGIRYSVAMSGVSGHQKVLGRLYGMCAGLEDYASEVHEMAVALPDYTSYADKLTMEQIISNHVQPIWEWLHAYAIANPALMDFSIHHHDVLSCKTLVDDSLENTTTVRKAAGIQVRLEWNHDGNTFEDSLTYNALDVVSLYGSEDAGGGGHTEHAVYAGCVESAGRTEFIGKHIEKLKWEVERSSQFAKEAVAIQSGSYPVVLSPRSTGLFIHECYGHQAEADFRTVGVKHDPVVPRTDHASGRFEEPVIRTKEPEVWDDGRLPGWGHCPVDDEGSRNMGVRLDCGARMHSRQTAESARCKPTGNGRAVDFTRDPLVRMTNTYMTAGDSSFEDLLQRVQEGIYIEDVAEGNGTDLFTLTPLKCWTIENGRLARPVRVSLMAGWLHELMDKVKGRSDVFELHAMVRGGCGKLDQFPLDVGFGGPHVWLEEVHLE